MGVHKGHRGRLKDRFLKDGLKNFADHNILELLLFYAMPRRDTNEIAHELLNHFGSLSSVFDATFEELIKIDGIGENAATLLKMVPSLAVAYLNDQLSDDMVLDTLEKTGNFLVPKFIEYVNEILIIISLNAEKKVISWDIIEKGSLNAVHAPIRKVVKTVLRTHASSVIIAHNHPGGIAAPSRNDIIASIEMANILRSIEVEVLDNIIVSGKEFTSIGDTATFFKDYDF